MSIKEKIKSKPWQTVYVVVLLFLLVQILFYCWLTHNYQ